MAVALRRTLLLIAAALLAWSLIPLTILLVQVIRDGGVLSGSDGILAGSDQQLYFTWIRESGSDLLISNEYRLGHSDGVFLHPVYALSGLLWRLGVGLELALWVWKPIAAGALGAGAWLLTGRFLAGRERVAAFALGLFFYSPVLPLLIWTDAGLSGVDHLVFLLVSNEAMPAIQLWGYLHAALGIGLTALAVLGIERLLRGDRPTWLLAATAGAALLVTWMHPWQGATLLAIMAGVAAWGRFDRRYLVLLVPAAAIGAALLYLFLLVQLDGDWSSYSDRNQAPHASWWILVLGLAPLVLAAVPAALRGGADDDGRRMLLIWPVAGLAVYFVTQQFPYHALQGLALPLAILAVESWRMARLPAWAGVACLVVVTLPGIAFLLDTFRDSRRSGIAPYVLRTEEHDALRHLEDAPRRSGVLARYYLGMTVPSRTGHDTWVGQFPWTPDSEERRARAEELFSGRMPPDAAQRFVREVGASYLLADCAYPVDLEPLLGDLVERTHRFGCSAVYELRE